MTFEVDVKAPGEVFIPFRVAPQSDGTVTVARESDGQCLETPTSARRDDRQTAFPTDCNQDRGQRFFFVPAVAAPTALAGAHPRSRTFFIVSADSGKCLGQGHPNNMNGSDRYPGATPRISGCDLNHVAGQGFRVHDERLNPDGIATTWRFVLNQAISYASRECAADPSACSVSPDSESTAARGWYHPNDDSLSDKGTLVTQNFGCGSPATIDGQTVSPRYTNTTQDNQTVQIGGQISVTNSTQSTKTFGSTTSSELTFGVKDLWGMKFGQSFTYQNQQVVGQTTAQTVTRTVTSQVRPGESLMAAWSGSVYSISGLWRFGEKLALANGSPEWTVPVSSSFPVSVGGQPLATVNTVTSKEPKNCDAVRASSTAPDQEPLITDVATACSGAAVTPDEAGAGTTLKACPGEWIVPPGKGSSTPEFRYQWYVFSSDGDPGRDIPGATKSTFTVQRSTYNGATPFLGVRVWEAGNANRLESRPPVLAQVAVWIKNPAGQAPGVSATNFVGDLDDATTRMPYRANLITDAGSSMSFSAADVPEGMTVSTDGVLEGIATTPGDYEIRLTDTPQDGGEPQQTVVELTVYDPPADFALDRSLEAPVDAPFSAALVPVVPEGMGLAVTGGELPDGVTLDAVSGMLAGTPTAAGSYDFVVEDAESPHTHGAFTMIVEPRAPVFAGSLASAEVGAAFSAPMVAAPGTESFFALTADSPALPDGLDLNGVTGLVSGTPVTPSTTELRIVDVAHPDSTSAATLVVAAAPATRAAGGKSATLAATGSDGAAAGLLAAGVGRARHRHPSQKSTR
jgi:hypothetical protein